MFDYSKRIVQLREQRGLTRSQLSRELNTNPTRISQLESGSSYPSVQMLDEIIKYFGISYSDFFNDETAYIDAVVIDVLESDIEQREGRILRQGTYMENHDARVTKEEMEMVRAYRKTSIAEKTAINALLAQYKENDKELEAKHA